MTTTAPNPLLSDDPDIWLMGMLDWWREAELEVLYSLSLAEGPAEPVPQKIHRRNHTTIIRNLTRTSSRLELLSAWVETKHGRSDLLLDLISRITKVQGHWRKLLTLSEAMTVVPDEPPSGRVPAHAGEVGLWIAKLSQWARPEADIIADLTQAITRRQPRSEEALDHIQWTVEDDIERIELVLKRAADWDLSIDDRTRLLTSSNAARQELTKLSALADQARSFSIELEAAAKLASYAKFKGQKLN
ncbi:hypothetical protein HYPGJ_31572 [Hyphomicrobium sp. GJ21]|jgi:hypothetical protein|uniref:hypothetical protein n=1 Tax=Hyphomicrobium sp. GJ21 TaxID=113574 RepID=UPI000622C11F|nr:hypothetical protein [Hyphomicrobium sp. GJ21]CEJ88070.1 hypothetical protein HYPGJ_31572 [Hyphomicrobium sp. GJ21]